MYSGWELEAGYFAKHKEPFSSLLEWLLTGGDCIGNFVEITYIEFEDNFDMNIEY